MNTHDQYHFPKGLDTTAQPEVVDRTTWQAELDKLRIREKAHTREGDAIAAARRRLPMVEVDATTPVIGAHGAVPFIDTFEGRSLMFASYHMWHTGRPAADQCEGCTFNTGHVLELSYLHSRNVTYAVFCEGPFDESNRYREFMGWEMPWYSVPESSVDALITGGQHFGMKVCYLRDGNRVFQTYWTTGRGCEIMGNSYGMLDMTVYGRQEPWEESPAGWPRRERSESFRSNGRSIAQWPRLAAGRSDDLNARP